jgi:branched-chain amino acid transport system permease protein
MRVPILFTVPRLDVISILLVNFIIYFGQYVIISTALNLQFGNAGIPNMSSNISVACGAYVVSSVVIRICMWIGGAAGLIFKPDWVYDNPYNVSMITKFLESQPILSLSIFVLSLALAFVFGSGLGWLLGSLGGRLRATRLMILLLIVSDAGGLIAANNEFVAGGTLGSFVPNFFAWYKGEHMIIIALVILIVGMVCYLITRALMNSPFGRLMRAVRENEVTLESTGKDVEQVRRQVMMFGSGMMAMAGVLLSFYYSFVQYQFYDRVTYTFWPWLMITIGGLGNNAGAFLGTVICVSTLKGINIIHQMVAPGLIGTQWVRLIGYFEDIALGSLLLLFLIFRPSGLIPEKRLHITGINYDGIINEKKMAGEVLRSFRSKDGD